MRIRRVYYILRATGKLPVQEDGKKYKDPAGLIGERINWLRTNGEIPWKSITDTHRSMEINPQWYDPAGFVEEEVEYFLTGYNRDLFQGCRYVPEIWLEKDAAVEKIRPITDKYHIRRVICRGQSSLTYCHFLAERARSLYTLTGQKTLVVFCNDMDPMGALMPLAVMRTLFEDFGITEEVEARRALLNADQVADLGLETEDADAIKGIRAVKQRFAHWLGVPIKEIYGCELDALSRQQTEDLLEETMWELIDRDEVLEQLEQEEADRERIVEIRSGVEDRLEELTDGDD